jgi:hypothetical protein
LDRILGLVGAVNNYEKSFSVIMLENLFKMAKLGPNMNENVIFQAI